MSSVKITNDLYSVSIFNPNMRVFDIVMVTDYGTSYNSYLLKGSEKTALIECCHKSFLEQYLNNIKQVAELSEIDYIILNHNEPDHSGCLAQLVEYCPNATIVASQAGALYLKNITNKPDLKIQVAKNGDEISLGNKTLKFISAPFLHWPDSMFTWVAEEKALFSCDFLGAHYCEPYTFDYNMAYPEKYEIAFKGYYDAIFGPFKPYVLAGLEKIKDLPIELLCTSHGPIITKNGRLEYVRKMYETWSQPAKNEKLTVPIFYTSAYGNTRKLAEAIKTGILEEKSDAVCDLYDIIDHDLGAQAQLLNSSDAFALGSPTINRDAVPPAWMLLSHVDAVNNQKKPVLVFGSYGWSGEGVPNLIARLQGLKMNVFGEGLKVTFVPSEEDLKKAKELGKEFARTL
ncbi:FprA family A-type flavoprotein [Youxingia wuxianensis]|uniref:FprA family A-type flavoprotein n=1 Tax=Youxingia wuxianensis TaxID=2763678 RepID=A0A926IGQ0_9FIRM|nr:FprA family A-type flavoprotein [Youxingia wuxianensis]MBC8584325.1 FprA family A-type flavoprotein [Youxingia wuxianensis]